MKILIPAAKDRASHLRRVSCERCGCVVEIEKKDIKNKTVQVQTGNYPEPGGGCSEAVEYYFKCPNKNCKTPLSVITEPHEKIF